MSVPYISPADIAKAMGDPEAAGLTPVQERIARDTASDLRRALQFGDMLDSLFAPRPRP